MINSKLISCIGARRLSRARMVVAKVIDGGGVEMVILKNSFGPSIAKCICPHSVRAVFLIFDDRAETVLLTRSVIQSNTRRQNEHKSKLAIRSVNPSTCRRRANDGPASVSNDSNFRPT